MTRLGNTNFGVFIQYHYTRTILRNKNMGQSLFKKYSKFWWNILLLHDQTQEHDFELLWYNKLTRHEQVCLASLNILVHDVQTYCIMNTEQTSEHIFTYWTIVLCVDTWKLLNQRKLWDKVFNESFKILKLQ